MVENKVDGELAEYLAGFDGADVAMIAMDSRGRIIYANAAAADLLGYVSSLLSGRSIKDFFPTDGVAKNVDLTLECSRFGKREFGHESIALLRTKESDVLRVTLALDTFVTMDDIVTSCRIDHFKPHSREQTEA